MTALKNVRIFDGISFRPEKGLSFENGKIIALCGEDGEDKHGWILAPGFIDLHMHGLQGHDAMRPGQLSLIAAGEVQFGTTAFCPASITADDDSTQVYLEQVRQARKLDKGARVLGAYLEGPFLAYKTRGAHDPNLLRDPSAENYRRLVGEYGKEVVRITLAPELPGGFELVKKLADQGVVVSIGHSEATYEQTIESINLGIGSTTHTCNGMQPLHHRNPGVFCAVLNDPRIKAEFIADLQHVHPQVLRLIFRNKGVEGCYYCTDSLEAAGLGDGEYHLGTDPQPIVVKNGLALKNGGLAGSTLTMDKGLRNLVNVVGLPLEQALRLGTYNPAQVMGRQDLGRIIPGACADFVLLDENLEVRETYVRGVCEYRKA
jgi:N-acetylglucosamine-6-phosphate deacetylase